MGEISNGYNILLDFIRYIELDCYLNKKEKDNEKYKEKDKKRIRKRGY